MLVDLCLRWKQAGLSPEVLALQEGGPTRQAQLRDAGVPVTVSGRSGAYSPRQVTELATTMARSRFDLVHVHLYPAQLWAAMALRFSPGVPPAITTEHSTWNRRRDWRWIRPLEKWMYSQFQVAVCIGLSTKDNLDAWMGATQCQTCVIANGIDLQRFRPGNTPGRLPEEVNGAPTILCIGIFEGRKDHETLVRAIAEVEGVHVLLVGEGPLKRDVEQLVRTLNVTNRVHFLGIRLDIPELIAAVDLYVQSSTVDGFCIAALEAMAGGLPLIASDIPGLGDLGRGCGLLFPPRDHHQLAACIRTLLLDPTLRNEVATRCVHRAQQYSVDETAVQYQRVFEAVLSKTPLQ